MDSPRRERTISKTTFVGFLYTSLQSKLGNWKSSFFERKEPDVQLVKGICKDYARHDLDQLYERQKDWPKPRETAYISLMERFAELQKNNTNPDMNAFYTFTMDCFNFSLGKNPEFHNDLQKKFNFLMDLNKSVNKIHQGISQGLDMIRGELTQLSSDFNLLRPNWFPKPVEALSLAQQLAICEKFEKCKNILVAKKEQLNTFKRNPAADKVYNEFSTKLKNIDKPPLPPRSRKPDASVSEEEISTEDSDLGSFTKIPR